MKDQEHEIEMVLLKELPASLQNWQGIPQRDGQPKYGWLYKKISALTPELPVARFKLANRKEAISIQSSINSTRKKATGKKEKAVHAPEGYRYATRTEPVASKDGEYFLYIHLVSTNGNSA